MRIILPGLILLLAACSPSGDPDTRSSLVERGQAIAQADCASCHALDAASPSPHAEAPPFRTLSERYPVASLQEALAEGIMVGHPDMPEFSFDPDEIDALIAFIESVQT